MAHAIWIRITPTAWSHLEPCVSWSPRCAPVSLCKGVLHSHGVCRNSESLHPRGGRGFCSTIPRPGNVDAPMWFPCHHERRNQFSWPGKPGCSAHRGPERSSQQDRARPRRPGALRPARPAVPALVVAVQAPGGRHLGLAVHPDLPEDALPLLQPLRALQLLRRREHVLIQAPLEAPVSADGEV